MAEYEVYATSCKLRIFLNLQLGAELPSKVAHFSQVIERSTVQVSSEFHSALPVEQKQKGFYAASSTVNP